jgi:hypothetical protein
MGLINLNPLKTNSCSATEEIRSIFWNLKVHHRNSQESYTDPYPELDESSPLPPILFLLRTILILILNL